MKYMLLIYEGESNAAPDPAIYEEYGAFTAEVEGKRPMVFTVCLECHNGTGSFGRQGDGVTLQSGSHNMTDPKYQNCTTCHVRIHGSNADRLFLR